MSEGDKIIVTKGIKNSFKNSLLLMENDADLISLSKYGIDFLKMITSKNKNIQKALNITKYGVPASILLYKLFKKYKNKKDNEKDDSIPLKACKILSTNGGYNYAVLNNIEIDILLMLLTKSFELKDLKVLGFYNGETLEKTLDPSDSKIKHLFIHINFKNNESVIYWNKTMLKQKSCDITFYTKTTEIVAIDSLSYSIIAELYKQYLIGSNLKDCSIKILCKNEYSDYFSREITKYPKKEYREIISNDYDIDVYIKEIKNILEMKSKRGYLFVGKPGTGKTSLIYNIESKIGGYPIIYLDNNNFNCANAIADCFNLLKQIQPCVIIIDDLDSCNLTEKTPVLAEFLKVLEDTNNDSSFVILAAINDINLLNEALLRPGRFDEVKKINTPRNIEEIYKIMNKEFNNIKIHYNLVDFISFEEIDKELLNQILKNENTQAEICEIVKKCLLSYNQITNEYLNFGFDYLNKSKNTIVEFSKRKLV